MLKFLWNGIKGSDKRLQRAFYNGGPWVTLPEGTITIYAKRGSRFSKEVASCFNVENDTNLMIDYFEDDKIRVLPSHPLYSEVAAALNAVRARNAA